jgi:hypothetical protein
MKKLIFTALSAAVLTACGGGGDSTPAATTSLSSITAATISLPSATSSVAGAGIAGNLDFLKFNNTTNQSTESATITGSGLTSVMAFPTSAFSVTGADSSGGGSGSTFFSNSYTGSTYAAGNVVAVCTSGTSASIVPSTELAIRAGQSIFISANLVPMTSLAAAAGSQFKTFNCANTADTNISTFNSDGTITNSNGSGNLTAAEVAGAFSSAGTTIGGANVKARSYRYAVNSTTNRYFTVLIITPTGGSTFVELNYGI